MERARVAFRYRAFISYSHRDKTWAAWLHRALETYAVPRRLVGRATAAGPVPARLAPIFRDSDELATARDLGQKVAEALEASACLLVVCSPDAARSRWVDEEIRTYQRLGGGERIFCLVVAGEPNASRTPGREAEECFPPSLRLRCDGDGNVLDDVIEPLAADVRPGGDGKADARYKLVAGMLGLDLDTLKRRALQRRARRAMALAAVALAIMVATTGLAINAMLARRDAVAASHVAERRQKDAEDLVAFMLGDLNERLAQVSRLDIMEAVDDRAMAYFQAQPTHELGARALMQRATALEKIGSVRLDQGRLDAALASYEAARVVAARLAQETPASVPNQLQLAEILSFIGMVHWRQGRLDEARKVFLDAQAVLDAASRVAPADRDLRFQLAMLDNNIGHVMEARGELDEAGRQYQRMLLLMQALARAQPGNAEWADTLGSAYNNLGKLALMRGDLVGAVGHYLADEAIQERLARAEPKDANRRDSLLTVLAIVGRTQALAGDTQAGMQRMQRAVDMAAALMLLDASNTDLQEHLALYATQLARLKRAAGDIRAATALTDKALPLFQALRASDPDNTAWQREYAETRIEQALQARQRGDAAAALATAAEALRVLGPLQGSQPDDRATLLAAIGARLALASVTRDAAEARALREQAVRDANRVKRGHGDPRLLALQVDALLSLGRRADAEPLIQKLWGGGYRDAALVQQLRRARIDYPVNAAFQRELLAATGGSR
ncbi:toll/interleukin-1 receptor domain-containing protein [Luteibacter yeojuensis]|uniref:toll/interleukin-1 receptor domain-containing protein n=1 Tax=Luteibacter yeojuensis TaxID=345309 RepID=UPI001E36F215|nr:toll/interleukin-1 receptor domain-containing protein [Luteibacter yeojuensis]